MKRICAAVPYAVMAGLVPAIPISRASCLPKRGPRAKPGDDSTDNSSRRLSLGEGGPGPILRTLSRRHGVWVPAFAGTTGCSVLRLHNDRPHLLAASATRSRHDARRRPAADTRAAL